MTIMFKSFKYSILFIYEYRNQPVLQESQLSHSCF
jgi:hypothetical protein